MLITFSSSTKKYKIIRRFMEVFKVWQFYDEEPLEWEDVRETFGKNGKVLAHYINRKLPLSQMIVVVIK